MGQSLSHSKTLMSIVLLVTLHLIPNEKTGTSIGSSLGLKKNERKKTMGISGSKMEVLYHIRPYFVGIFPYIALT